MTVAPALDTHVVVSPHTLAVQLLAARDGDPQTYQDLLASTAALATHSNANATARLLELLIAGRERTE